MGGVNRIFYSVKPLIPRRLQLALRRRLIAAKLQTCKEVWPIDASAATPPKGWPGWPGGKKFALVLTHDVDTRAGQAKCENLIRLEDKIGVRSSFNFVPERYQVSDNLRSFLAENGFEVGVHGLKHDGKLFKDKNTFLMRSKKINKYLQEWNSVGFRAPAMHHNLEWIGNLKIEYDLSTFDTDPFEPQSDGVRTIFPFCVDNSGSGRSYLELPYTLPQDFTLFVLMKHQNIDVWKKKLDWIVNSGGMALVNTHPDYMNFGDRPMGVEEYPHERYGEFLNYVKGKYNEDCCYMLPCELASYLRTKTLQGSAKENIRQTPSSIG